jgi:hypothetical protein
MSPARKDGMTHLELSLSATSALPLPTESADSAVHCKTCRYFENDRHLGECHRTPGVLEKGPGDWCGEWKPKRQHGNANLTGLLLVLLDQKSEAGFLGTRPRVP